MSLAFVKKWQKVQKVPQNSKKTYKGQQRPLKTEDCQSKSVYQLDKLWEKRLNKPSKAIKGC
jgi:hypothetical protein